MRQKNTSASINTTIFGVERREVVVVGFLAFIREANAVAPRGLRPINWLRHGRTHITYPPSARKGQRRTPTEQTSERTVTAQASIWTVICTSTWDEQGLSAIYHCFAGQSAVSRSNFSVGYVRSEDGTTAYASTPRYSSKPVPKRGVGSILGEGWQQVEAHY